VGHEDLRLAVACLSAEQRRAYIKLVRQQYRADRREYQHTVLAAELGTDPAGIADARAARAGAGAGGGHKRAAEANQPLD
jgi:hypothetical protein